VQTFLIIRSMAVTLDRETERIRTSLVRLIVTSQTPDYQNPWNPGGMGGGVGSGFIISGNRIMTNAHVVSDARFISIDKDGDPQKYIGRVIHIAHDCDLALLTVDDTNFFSGTSTLEFNGIPELHSSVTAYGYPIGGERMSVTRGVVSRIEFRVYAHSGLDSHLTIQIDAAINPGNSGGPVLQDNKVVGVAFQGFSGAVAQNTGYMIPAPVISRFLKDVEDGHYGGYVELGVSYLNLLNPAYRKAMGLSADMTGVVITKVLQAGSAYGELQSGDILLKIDGYPLTNDGHIVIDRDYVQMEEVVERKFHGDNVVFDLLRDGKLMTGVVTLKGAWPYKIMVNQYDKKPEFVLFAGLLFQPMTRNFLNAYKISDPELNYYFNMYVANEIYLERPQIIVLSAFLPDPINTYWGVFMHKIVDEVNGRKIRVISDVAAAFAESPEYYIVKLLGEGKPIVIAADQVAAARKRILARYGVTQEQYFVPE
jgi:S1-C subfamily serine protease